MAGIFILSCTCVMLDVCQGSTHGIWFQPHVNPVKSSQESCYLSFMRSELRLGLRYSLKLTRIESDRTGIHIRTSGSTVSSLLGHSINTFDKLSAYSCSSIVLRGVAASEWEGKSLPLFACSLQSGAKDIKQMPLKLFTTFTKQCTYESEIINFTHKDLAAGGRGITLVIRAK